MVIRHRGTGVRYNVDVKTGIITNTMTGKIIPQSTVMGRRLITFARGENDKLRVRFEVD